MRHIEKLKKILKPYGKNISTNGEALDKIMELFDSGKIVNTDSGKAELVAFLPSNHVRLLKLLKYKSENS